MTPSEQVEKLKQAVYVLRMERKYLLQVIKDLIAGRK